MRLIRTRTMIVSLTCVAAATAILTGGAVLLLRGTSPTRTSPLHQPRKSYIIMEGVDINSNGPGHPKPALQETQPSGRRELLPPDLHSREQP